MATGQQFTNTDNNRQLETVTSFNADEPLILSATNASGRIEVHTDPARPSGSMLIAVRRTDDNPFDDDDNALTVKVDGNSISIHPDWQFAAGVSGLARRVRDQLQHGFRPEDWNLSRLRLSPELDFHIFISLPAGLADGSHIKLRSASGEIAARDIAAQISIVTASGDVNAAELSGITAIHTASGDVHTVNIVESLEINTASGDATVRSGDIWLAARSASGDVSVQDTRLRNSRITTVSGDVDVRAVFDNTGSYGMETVSGDVTLEVTVPGSDTSARLGFGTLSGSSTVRDDWRKTGRREWHVGDGETGTTISVKTVSGDLSATSRRDPSVAARSIEMPPSRKDRGDLEQDMSELSRGMKHFGKGMTHFGHLSRPTPPTPPAPPTLPTPPAPPAPPSTDDWQSVQEYERAMQDYEQELEQHAHDHEEAMLEYEQEVERQARDHEQAMLEYEQQLELQGGDHDQRMRGHEQRIRDHEQRVRDHEQRRRDREQVREQRRAERGREREQRRADRRQDRELRRRGNGDPHIFTAGPSGRSELDEQQPPASNAQQTEPVAPTQPFQEEATTMPDATSSDNSQHTEPVAATNTTDDQQAATPEPAVNDRLTILELLERGEIDIDEAMTRLESAGDPPSSQ